MARGEKSPRAYFTRRSRKCPELRSHGKTISMLLLCMEGLLENAVKMATILRIQLHGATKTEKDSCPRLNWTPDEFSFLLRILRMRIGQCLGSNEERNSNNPGIYSRISFGLGIIQIWTCHITWIHPGLLLTQPNRTYTEAKSEWRLFRPSLHECQQTVHRCQNLLP